MKNKNTGNKFSKVQLIRNNVVAKYYTLCEGKFHAVHPLALSFFLFFFTPLLLLSSLRHTLVLDHVLSQHNFSHSRKHHNNH